MKDIIESLRALGLNGYEAKVYVALLQKHPATGYEVAKLANIPQSRAYDTLKTLEKEQVVSSLGTKPETYMPVKPKDLLKRLKRKFDSDINFLEKKLPDIKMNYNDPIHHITDFVEIKAKIKEIIQSAKREVYIEVWSQEFKYIESDLFDCYNRGLEIKIVGYDNFRCNFGTVYYHKNGREIEHALNGRMIFLIADNSECLFGKIYDKVIWTNNGDIAFLLKEFIVHDMYLLDIEQSFPEQLKYFYGTDLKRLKEKVLTHNHPFIIH